MNYKRIILLASIALTSLAFGRSFEIDTQGFNDMKLINLNSEFVIAEVQDGKIRFYDRFLEKEMKNRGILIPLALKNDYSGKTRVLLEDQEFLKAFTEIFVPSVYNPESVIWQE